RLGGLRLDARGRVPRARAIRSATALEGPDRLERGPRGAAAASLAGGGEAAPAAPGTGARARGAGGPRPVRGQGARRARIQAREGGCVNPFGDPRKLMKQLQQAQEKMQAEIAALVVEASTGGGMVKVEMDGQKHVKSLKIDPEVVSREDVEMLQD